jgi:PAS domain S-box-containing protein
MDGSKRWPFNVADVLRSMSDAVVTIDAAKKITSMNAAAEAMIGTSEADAIGRRCAEVVRSAICGPTCPFKDVLERGETAVNFNVLLERQDGRRLPVSIGISPLKDASKRTIGVVESIRDISHVLRLLGEIDRSKEEIARKEDRMRILLQTRGRERLGHIIGRNPKMQEIFELIQVVAKSDVTVLIQGESGTGKELVASTIHSLSHRRGGPFIRVSCAALPESLLESELFGHVRGAFTGAIKDKPGRFELADRGTILLDEVGEMSPTIQVKLLRVLQEHAFERVGGTRTLKVDVRVIGASNRDLRKAVEEGRLREDLFYRLNVVPVFVPPLRDRKEDIPLMISSILERLSSKGQCESVKVSPEAIDLLMTYDWPGNVRELENALEFALVRKTGDWLLPQSLPPWIQKGQKTCHGVLKDIAKESEREEIVKRLAQCRGKLSDVAKALGVGRTTLWRKMKYYQISRRCAHPSNVPEMERTEAPFVSGVK